MMWVGQLVMAGARGAAVELIKAATIAGVTYGGWQLIKYRKGAVQRAMGQEQQKILEMVASGKISPEDGVRLLNALGQSGPSKRNGFDLPDVKLPRIDLSGLGEVALELKNTVIDTAGKARSAVQRSKAGKYLDPKVYEIEGPAAEGIATCELKLKAQAGKLKLKAADTEGRLLKGRIKRVADQPELQTSVVDGTAKIELDHSLGAALLAVIDWPTWKITLDGAAADVGLDLRHLKVSQLSIENNAGNVAARLSGLLDSVEVDLQNIAGNTVLEVPGSHAIRIVAKQTLSGSNLEKLGLNVESGSAQSTDWEHNHRRVQIVLEQHVANFDLRWQRGPGEGYIEVLDDTDDDDIIPSKEL